MIRAYVSGDQFGFGVHVGIIKEPTGDETGPRLILRFGLGGPRWDDFDPMAAAELPTFTLDDSSARALLDALTRHYHGAEDTRALRKDYDAERQRVDKTVGTISQLALALAGAALWADKIVTVEQRGKPV